MSNQRQTIVDAVVDRLKTISTVNGYNLEINNSVFDWKMNSLEPDALPAILVRDTAAEIEITTMAGDLSHRLKLSIHILASGNTAPAIARKGLQDISRAMYTDRLFGGLIRAFIPESTNLEMMLEENLITSGEYTCTMTYHTAPGEI